MLNKNLFVKLDNDCFLDENISNDELLVFLLIQKSLNEAKCISTFNVNLLLDYMYIDPNNSHKISENIIKSIFSLKDKKLIKNIYNTHFNKIKMESRPKNCDNKSITYFAEINSKTMLIAEIEPYKTNFFTINELELEKLFSHLKNKNIKKSSIVRYFIAIQRVINYSSEIGVGYLAQNKCKKLIGENKTIAKYNEILQDELKLIRYCNDYMTPEYKYHTTFFGRYDNENKFNQFVDQEVRERCLVKTNKSISNKKRSTKQIINNLESKPNKTKSDIEELDKVKKEHDELQYKPKSLEITEEMITDYDELDEIFG